MPTLATRHTRQLARGCVSGVVIGGTVCLALTPVTPIGVPILCAAVGIVVGVPRPTAPAAAEVTA